MNSYPFGGGEVVAVMSFVRNRGRAVGVAAVMAMSMALLSAPAAFGAADGDPIATSTFKFKLKGAFKKQLKKNGVKMKSKGFKVSKKLNSDVDPITGKADLRLGKIVFKKGKNKIVYNSLKGTLPGNVTSSQSGKLFKITKAKVDRNGYGASLTGIKVKFLKGAAKKINRRLDLNSLKKGNVGSIKLSYQPETVKIISGVAQTTSAPVEPLDLGEFGGSAGAKLRFGHCVDGVGSGITPIAPGTKEVLGPTGPAIFRFPVVGGEISPDGTEGLSEASGGLTIKKSESGPSPGEPGTSCASSPYGELSQQAITTDISARTISSEVNIVASSCAAGTVCGPGPKGRAVGQTVDTANSVVTIDKANRTFTLSGSTVRLAPSSATVLNAVFPCVSNCTDGGIPGNLTMEGGDPFGTSRLTVTTR